jgi:hypothetical protein
VPVRTTKLEREIDASLTVSTGTILHGRYLDCMFVGQQEAGRSPSARC